jgi:putative membrane protein
MPSSPDSPPSVSRAGQEARPSDPDPRFTLANERTFLAWIRTSLALIAGGLALSQLAKPHSHVLILVSSLALILFGALMSLLGFWHWKRNEALLERGETLGRSGMPALLTQGIALFSVVAAVLAIIRLTS